MFACSYVRFSLDTVHMYDNVLNGPSDYEINQAGVIITFQCFHTLARDLGWFSLLMTRAMSVIDNCINKLCRLNKIKGKHKVKWAKMRKKGYGGKHTRPNKWSGARRTCWSDDDGLDIVDSIMLFEIIMLRYFMIGLYESALNH